MNNTITFAEISAIVLKIEEVAGAVLMAAGLLFFVLWFGWNMNNYLGNIGAHLSGAGAGTVPSAEYSPIPPAAIAGEH